MPAPGAPQLQYLDLHYASLGYGDVFVAGVLGGVLAAERRPQGVAALLVPPGSHEPPPQHGIVLAVGPGLDWWEHVGVRMPVKPGDHVVFPASAGAWVEVDEERLLVCRVGELLGVLESESEAQAA